MITENPCLNGQPLEDYSGRAKQCSEESRCPANFFCHVGVSDNVCCPITGILIVAILDGDYRPLDPPPTHPLFFVLKCPNSLLLFLL